MTKRIYKIGHDREQASLLPPCVVQKPPAETPILMRAGNRSTDEVMMPTYSPRMPGPF